MICSDESSFIYKRFFDSFRSVTSGLRPPISTCLQVVTRLFSSWMLNWWQVDGSTAYEPFPCTHLSSPRTRQDTVSREYRFSSVRYDPIETSPPASVARAQPTVSLSRFLQINHCQNDAVKPYLHWPSRFAMPIFQIRIALKHRMTESVKVLRSMLIRDLAEFAASKTDTFSKETRPEWSRPRLGFRKFVNFATIFQKTVTNASDRWFCWFLAFMTRFSFTEDKTDIEQVELRNLN